MAGLDCVGAVFWGAWWNGCCEYSERVLFYEGLEGLEVVFSVDGAEVHFVFC